MGPPWGASPIATLPGAGQYSPTRCLHLPLGRTRLCLASSQTFYLLVNNKGLPNMAVTMQELYRDNKDEDGFLYLTYASQEMFGSSSSSEPAAA